MPHTEHQKGLSRPNHSQQPSPTLPLSQSPTSGVRERVGRVKGTKLMGWDKDSSIGQAIATQANKQNNASHG